MFLAWVLGMVLGYIPDSSHGSASAASSGPSISFGPRWWPEQCSCDHQLVAAEFEDGGHNGACNDEGSLDNDSPARSDDDHVTFDPGHQQC